MGNTTARLDDNKLQQDTIANSSQSFAARLTESQIIHNEGEDFNRDSYKQSRNQKTSGYE